MVAFSNETNIATIISDGYFNPNEPIAYVTLNNNATSFEATNVRFYGEDADNVSYKFNFFNQTHDNLLSNAMPNPAETSTEILVNIPENGHYSLTISDVNGNIVKVITNEYFNQGNVNFI